MVIIKSTGEEALTIKGKDEYNNNFTNFGVNCGDSYVESFQ